MAFDLRRFAESSEPVKYEDLDFDTFLSQPLDEQTLRSLRYMCDVEYHTSCFLRDLLVTPSHREEDAGGFMTMWNREEFWHGEALAAVLAKHGIIVDYDELKAKRVKLGWAGALGPLKQSVMSNLVGSDFVAVHMVWGAGDDVSAGARYRGLGGMTDQPPPSPRLQRIAEQGTLHVASYTSEGRQRLQAAEGGERIVRLSRSRVWKPVGSGMRGE